MLILAAIIAATFFATILAGIVLAYLSSGLRLAPAVRLTDTLGASGFRSGFVMAAFIAALASGAATIVINRDAMASAAPQKGVLIYSASLAQLPHLAELYTTAPGPLYFYDQGDLAVTLANAAKDKKEIDKYRRFLAYAIQIDKGMHAPSRANLHYAIGKISLALDDKNGAQAAFRQAFAEHRPTVESKLETDTLVRDFLAANPVQ